MPSAQQVACDCAWIVSEHPSFSLRSVSLLCYAALYIALHFSLRRWPLVTTLSTQWLVFHLCRP